MALRIALVFLCGTLATAAPINTASNGQWPTEPRKPVVFRYLGDDRVEQVSPDDGGRIPPPSALVPMSSVLRPNQHPIVVQPKLIAVQRGAPSTSSRMNMFKNPPPGVPQTAAVATQPRQNIAVANRLEGLLDPNQMRPILGQPQQVSPFGYSRQHLGGRPQYLTRQGLIPQMENDEEAKRARAQLAQVSKKVLEPLISKLAGTVSKSLGVPEGAAAPVEGLWGTLQGLSSKVMKSIGLESLLAQRGPPVPGVPGLPGFFSRLTGGQAQPVDLAGIASALGKKLVSMTKLDEKLRPEMLQKFADNLTGIVTPTMDNVSIKKMMGRWFEALNSPKATAQRCIVHHFGGLTQNENTATFTALKIYREGSDFGAVHYSIGYAFQSGLKPGMLQIHSSESEEPVPFWIFKVGNATKDSVGNEQYEYAIVSNWVRYPVTVLVRDPDRYKKLYEEEVMKWLEQNKFINLLSKTFNLLEATDYSNCQYPPKTFEIFS